MNIIVKKSIICINCAGDCNRCIHTEDCEHWSDHSQRRREYVEVVFNDIVLSEFYRDENAEDFIIINLTPHPIQNFF